jgi:hypothetical protein
MAAGVAAGVAATLRTHFERRGKERLWRNRGALEAPQQGCRGCRRGRVPEADCQHGAQLVQARLGDEGGMAHPQGVECRERRWEEGGRRTDGRATANQPEQAALQVPHGW